MLSLFGRPSQLLLRACTATSGAPSCPAPLTAACIPSATSSATVIQVRTVKRQRTTPKLPIPLGRLAYQKEHFMTPEDRTQLDGELSEVSVFDGQKGVLYKSIVDELAAEHIRYIPRIAPIAVSYLYSVCQNTDELAAVMMLHKRYRSSSSDLGGGSHSISHNAVIACLRLGQLDTALDLLMNKYEYSVWPPAATYTQLLDYALAKYQENPDLLTEVYEAAFTVMRDGVDLTPTLASLCVTALSIHDPNDAGSEDEVTDPPVPYTQANVPGWTEKEYKDSRDLPHWANQLETRHERLAAAVHLVKQQHEAGHRILPVAYSYLVSTLGKLGQHEKLLDVLTMAVEDGALTSQLEGLKKQLTQAASREDMVELLKKMSSGDGEEESGEEKAAAATSPFDGLVVSLPTTPSSLAHTTDGMTQVPVVDGLSVNMTGEGISGEKKMKSYYSWIPVTTFTRWRKNVTFKVRSTYKMPPRRVLNSETHRLNDAL
eukprot:scpid77591/ scgid16995/ 